MMMMRKSHDYAKLLFGLKSASSSFLVSGKTATTTVELS